MEEIKEMLKEIAEEVSEEVVTGEDAEPSWRDVEFTADNSFLDLVGFLNAVNERICDLEDKIVKLENNQKNSNGFFRMAFLDDKE